MGIYSLSATLPGRVVFGIPFHIAHPVLFAVALPTTILGLGLLGMLFASTFVLYRARHALSNMLEWPVLLVTGMLVPTDAAAQLEATGSHGCSPRPGGCARSARPPLGGDPLPAIGMTLALGLTYLGMAALALRRFEFLARKQAALVADMTAVRTNLRLFFVGGFISYRALFNWIRPAFYIPTMLIGPVFQILFFTYLGRYSRLQSDTFFVIGNAVQVSGMSAVFSGDDVDRERARLPARSRRCSRRPRTVSPCSPGGSVPVLVNGLFVSAFGVLA